MSGETIANLAYVAGILIVGSLACWWMCKDEPDEGGDEIGVAVWDSAAEKWVTLAPGAEPGPGQMTAREVEEADQLELLYLAPAYGETDLNAGCERLWQAVRDEQQKGEQA